MATYGLKYTAEFQNSRKWFYRLRVYQRDYSGTSKTMGDLCGCALEIQGNMGSIVSPIVKTQLRFSLVDSYDKTDTAQIKYGDWQEFFTPDATLYKVVLSEAETGSSYTDIWAGYITPDSWQESLDYRGAITITARDNIGHLKDFPFKAEGRVTPDANGLIALTNIFLGAMDVIEFPMTMSLDTNGTHEGSTYAPYEIQSQDGVKLRYAYVNAALFEGMNWYDVLEQTLEAVGFTFRYTGRGMCRIGYLRNMPRLNNAFDPTETQELEFYGGTLELDPAVKRIEEEQDYKEDGEVSFELLEGLQYAATTTYRCKTDGNTLPGGGVVYVPEHDADKNNVSNGGQTGWLSGSGMLDPSLYEADVFVKRAEGEDGWRNYAFIASNQVLNGSSPVASYSFKTRTSAMKITVRFTPNAMTINNNGTDVGKMDGAAHYALSKIQYYVIYSDGTTTRYWNGGTWVSGSYINSKDYDAQNGYATDLEIETGECTEISSGTLTITFGQIVYKMWSEGGYGCYARVAEIKAEINSTTTLKSNKITTINNDNYNVLFTRKPLFGTLSREMSYVKPENYLAGLFFYRTVGSYPELLPYMMKFDDQTDDYLVPFPVLIHQQILCYYYGAARVLTGSCAAVTDAITGRGHYDFGKLATYKGRNYLFQGGTLDLFSGIINSACFREYIDYDELWDGTPPSYSEDVKYNN